MTVIALDAASLDLITGATAEGRLPNFGRILDAGSVMHLATIHPTSPEAVWAAAATGKLPQKNGVRSAGIYHMAPGGSIELLPDYCLAHDLVRRLERPLVGAEDYFKRHGGKTVAIGRYATAAGAFVPFVAGMSRMDYRRFLMFDIPAIVRSCRGEKHNTRQVPCSPSARRSPSSTRSIDASGCNAAKSFVKTNVSAYVGFVSPLARVFPGHR